MGLVLRGKCVGEKGPATSTDQAIRAAETQTANQTNQEASRTQEKLRNWPALQLELGCPEASQPGALQENRENAVVVGVQVVEQLVGAEASCPL